MYSAIVYNTLSELMESDYFIKNVTRDSHTPLHYHQNDSTPQHAISSSQLGITDDQLPLRGSFHQYKRTTRLILQPPKQMIPTNAMQ